MPGKIPWLHFFLNLFEKEHLVDVALLKLEPTWPNKRGGSQAISKRLDHFLIKDNLVNENLIIKSFVEIGGSSGHRPISLLTIPHEKKPPAPFKFNPQCFEDEQYRDKILNAW